VKMHETPSAGKAASFTHREVHALERLVDRAARIVRAVLSTLKGRR